MNLLALLYFFSFTLYLGLMAFVLAKKPQAKLNIVCSLFILCFVIWNLGATFMRSAEYKSQIMLWQNISSFGWVSFASFFFWQTLLITGKEKISKSFFFYLGIFSLNALFIQRQWSGYLINDFIKRPFGWANVWGESIWPALFHSYYFLLVLVSIILLLNYRKKTENPYKKKQVALISLTMLAALLIGSLTDVVFPQAGFYLIPPLGSVTSLIWAGGLVLAISKYGMMSLTPAMAASNILASMSDALILLTPGRKIITLNRSAEKLLGYSKKELSGKPAEIIFTGEGSILTDKNIKENPPQSTLWEECLYLQTRSGKSIPITLSASAVIDKEGIFAGIVAIARDMRETIKKNRELKESYRRQAEMHQKLALAEMSQKLARTEKMAIMGALAGSVGNDLRTPLSSIKNITYYLENYGSIDDPEIKKCIDILMKETRNVDDIVTTLLDFSHTWDPHLKDVNIKDCVDRVVKKIREPGNVKIVKDIPPEADTVRADPKKFEHLMRNLIKNSYQAIKDGGSIKIKTEKKPEGINIHISDTGDGMDKETLDNLFEPLYTTKKRSSGIGMPIIKNIVDAHGWKIDIKSSPGKGTNITLKAVEQA